MGSQTSIQTASRGMWTGLTVPEKSVPSLTMQAWIMDHLIHWDTCPPETSQDLHGILSDAFGLATNTSRSREVVMNKPVPSAIPLAALCVMAAVLAFNVAQSVVLAAVMMLLAVVLPVSLRMANQWER